MWYSVPPQPQIQGKPLGGAPVVLNIRGPRNVVPETVVLNRKLVIRLGVTQQEIRKVNPGVVIVEGEEALSLTEQILDLLIQRPTGTHLELVRSLGPGNVVANLVIVRLVVPGPAGRGVFGAGFAIQFDFRDAVEVIRTRKQPRRGEAGGTCDYTLG